MAVSTVRRIAAFSLNTAALGPCVSFYRDALGFDAEQLGERTARLRLGAQTVDLAEPAPPGAPYPPGSSSCDRWFQHFAIVVSDMEAAYARLAACQGWVPISRDGPQRLPAASGGVTAYKFRDPEGHPLELLAFPPGGVPPAWQGRQAAGPCLGLDHSAIVVADTAASIAFYARLGFSVTTRSLNRGPEQARLDGLPDPVVEVTALAPAGQATPHLELLCYCAPASGRAHPVAAADIAATCLVLEADDPAALLAAATPANASGAAAQLADPDGHRLVLRG